MTRILVVEDEQHLADGLRFNLESEGYEVQVVETGEAALELLLAKGAAFDVVVLDVMLPGIDGFAAMSSMRRAGQFVPVLMLTARGQAEDVLRGFAAGADETVRSSDFDGANQGASAAWGVGAGGSADSGRAAGYVYVW